MSNDNTSATDRGSACNDGLGHAPSLRVAIFDWLCRKYVQRADSRQKSMGLQYMEAETHDLAEEIAARLEAEFAAERERCAKECEAEAALWRGKDGRDFRLCAARIRSLA